MFSVFPFPSQVKIWGPLLRKENGAESPMIMCNGQQFAPSHSHLVIIHSETVPEQSGGRIVALKIHKQQRTPLVQNPAQKNDQNENLEM